LWVYQQASGWTESSSSSKLPAKKIEEEGENEEEDDQKKDALPSPRIGSHIALQGARSRQRRISNGMMAGY
jgi:hypothetical protein